MNDDRTRVLETLDGFRTAMLCTMSPEGVLHTRPMQVAGREDAVLWFATSEEAGAVAEIRALGQACASFQSPLVYAAVSGPATIVTDRERIADLWTDAWAAWFPKGPDDPDLVLLRLEGRSADLWDLRGGAGLRAAVRTLRALLGRPVAPPNGGGSQHVRL